MKRARSSGFRAAQHTRLAGLGVVALFLLASETRSVWLQVAGCGLLGLIAASAIALAIDKGCLIAIDHPSELVAGVGVELSFEVHNPHGWRSRALVVRYAVDSPRPLLPEVTLYVDPVAAGDRVVVRVPAVPLARGEAASGRLSVEQVGPFGLFSIRPTRTTDKPLVVAPAAAAPLDLDLIHGGADGVGPLHAGLDVRGVREWRPGDAVRHVHWRSTARSGRLTVLERAEPAGATLGVVIVGRAGEPRFEAVLATAAATVGVAVAEGVDCYAWLEQPGAGCFGRLTSQSLLRPFTRAELPNLPSDKGFSHLLEHIGQGSTLLLAVADDVPSGWLGQLAAAATASDITVVDLREFAA
ncbi:MAG TPA: DUF58 domain-containing protein [Acidothermaceae bacterium]|nr:DUF58 domain-containing protein [Acidothermaceae bacterium]